LILSAKGSWIWQGLRSTERNWRLPMMGNSSPKMHTAENPQRMWRAMQAPGIPALNSSAAHCALIDLSRLPLKASIACCRYGGMPEMSISKVAFARAITLPLSHAPRN
jgi:hypothetical protein